MRETRLVNYSEFLMDKNNSYFLINLIKKDICFLFHELSDYSSIMGDLDYSVMYGLPYWEFLNAQEKFENISEYDSSFIVEGCLVMILAMAWEMIDGAGCYIADKIERIKTKLSKVIPENEKQCKLLDIVIQAVENSVDLKVKVDTLLEQSAWVHKEFVEGYFDRKSVQAKY